MKLDEFTKQPYEEFQIGVDFSANLDDAVNIVSQVVTATDRAGNDATNDVLVAGSALNDGHAIVNVTVKGGTTDRTIQPYKITFRTVDSNGFKWEFDVLMEVKET